MPAGARSGPFSSGMPSGPSSSLPAAVEVAAVIEVGVVADAVELAVAEAAA